MLVAIVTCLTRTGIRSSHGKEPTQEREYVEIAEHEQNGSSRAYSLPWISGFALTWLKRERVAIFFAGIASAFVQSFISAIKLS